MFVSLASTLEDECQGFGLGPSADFVEKVDRALRRRLASSLNYLTAWFDDDRRLTLTAFSDRLIAAPVSPWVFCLYSKVVTQLSRGNQPGAATALDALVHAGYLSTTSGVVGFRDPKLPETWWDQFEIILDTDRNCPFNPSITTKETALACMRDVNQGLTMLKRADPQWHAETESLLRMLVLAGPESSDTKHFFNGASSFFLWGGLLVNAQLRRNAMSIVELLVHETSHGLLFAIAAESGLTRNSSTERYDSPVRADKRPIDGIFHACFVATRVHLAMGRLIASRLLCSQDTASAMLHRECSQKAALESLKVVEHRAALTELGKSILAKIRSYWDENAPLRDRS